MSKIPTHLLNTAALLFVISREIIYSNDSFSWVNHYADLKPQKRLLVRFKYLQKLLIYIYTINRNE